MPVDVSITDAIATLRLNDPARRNAMTVAMFDALDDAIARVREDASVRVVLLCGAGGVFCAGFDLRAAADQPELMATFINRLSALNRALRRLPQVVVAAVEGAAIAGGCAVLSACDFVFAAADAKLGYPVHRIGVSPAVTIPTLQMAIGPGQARSLLMAGELIDGETAHRIGLITHLSESGETVHGDVMNHCHTLAAKPPHALRVTKAWLNEIDGSLDDGPFDQAAVGSTSLTGDDEAVSMLRAIWQAQE